MSFVAGGCFITLFAFVVFFDEDFFTADFTGGRSVTWYLGATGTQPDLHLNLTHLAGLIIALSRTLIPDEVSMIYFSFLVRSNVHSESSV